MRVTISKNLVIGAISPFYWSMHKVLKPMSASASSSRVIFLWSWGSPLRGDLFSFGNFKIFTYPDVTELKVKSDRHKVLIVTKIHVMQEREMLYGFSYVTPIIAVFSCLSLIVINILARWQYKDHLPT